MSTIADDQAEGAAPPPELRELHDVRMALLTWASEIADTSWHSYQVDLLRAAARLLAGGTPAPPPAPQPDRHRPPTRVVCCGCDSPMEEEGFGVNGNTSDESYYCRTCDRSVRLIWLGEIQGPFANPEHDPDECGCENHAPWCPFNPHATEVKPYPFPPGASSGSAVPTQKESHD